MNRVNSAKQSAKRRRVAQAVEAAAEEDAAPELQVGPSGQKGTPQEVLEQLNKMKANKGAWTERFEPLIGEGGDRRAHV